MLENNTQNKKAVKSIVLRIDKKHRWAILVAFIISLIGHIIPVFTDWDFKWDEIEIVKQKPLSMKFVQRAPRLVKPMELRKKPKIVQRTFTKITQTQKSFKPRSMRTAAMHGGTVLASLARPTDPVQRILSIMPEDVPLGADISNTAVTVNKEQDLKSLDENLLNAGDMNYGRYNSYVTVDPDNKKNIKGFIKMGLLKYQAEFLDYGGMPDWNTSPNALQNLSEYLRDNSGIKAEHSFIFDLTDHEYIDKKVAFLLMTGHRNFKFSSEESKNIAEYVLKGGFLFIDDSDFRKGALNLASVVRPNRMFTADKSIILYKAGSLKQSKINEVENVIVGMFTS